MKLVGALVLLSGVVALVSSSDLFTKQKAVLDVFQHVFQHNLHNVDFFKQSQEFKFVPEKYDDAHVYNYFNEKYRLIDFHDHEEYTITEDTHRDATYALYKFFVSAKDLDTFYRTVAWARYHVHPNMFIQAFQVAVLHRDDMKGVTFPAIYEINPYFFFNSKVVEDAMAYQMQGYDGVEKHDGAYTVYIPANYTGQYMHYNQETLLTYFTEDIGLNAWYYDFYISSPQWIHDTKVAEDRAFRYIKFYQNILARYYMERLSNNLGTVEQFSWTEPISIGYSPDLRYYDGDIFPSRSDDHHLYNKYFYGKVDKIKALETMIMYHFEDLKPEIRYQYINEYIHLARGIISGSLHNEIPGALEHIETSMRDPMFYEFFKRFLLLLPYQDSYKRKDLIFDGVKIESVEMDKLVTYFDKFDADITNVIDVNPHYDATTAKSELVKFGRFAQYKGEDVVIKARQYRLNHLEFTYKVNVFSDKVQKGKLRVFIGPKYDEFGNAFDVNENRENFYELDVYEYEFKEGKNVISRSCSEFPYFVKDYSTYYDLYKYVFLAKKGDHSEFKDFNRHGFPWRLMLPKGKKEGFPVQFFFIISPDHEVSFERYNVRRYTFPLDRKIDEAEWFTPNMFYYDTMIFHKKEKEVHH